MTFSPYGYGNGYHNGHHRSYDRMRANGYRDLPHESPATESVAPDGRYGVRFEQDYGRSPASKAMSEDQSQNFSRNISSHVAGT